MRLLLIDDDEILLDALSKHFIAQRNDPNQFWQFIQASSPDLLVLDIEMPDINGMELCRQLRSDSNWSHLPVLFLTAHQDLETLNQAFAVGADDYVSKPVKGTELTTRILNRMSRIRAIQSNTNYLQKT